MRSFAIFVLVSSLTGLQCQDFTYDHVHNVTTYRPFTRKLKNKNESNYMGYANNPFGSSMRLQQNLNEINTSQWMDFKIIMEEIRQSDDNDTDDFEDIIDDYEEVTTQEPRSKRGVVHLYNMVSCATGCNPLKYKGYGCYCGFLGSGYPVDGIDRCCKRHDWCYDAANCPAFLEYFVPYVWKCYYNKPLCAINYRKHSGFAACARRLCECDRVLSECLSHYPCPSSRAYCKSAPLRLLQNTFMIFP